MLEGEFVLAQKTNQTLLCLALLRVIGIGFVNLDVDKCVLSVKNVTLPTVIPALGLENSLNACPTRFAVPKSFLGVIVDAFASHDV